jgi:hypothetical protein
MYFHSMVKEECISLESTVVVGAKPKTLLHTSRVHPNNHWLVTTICWENSQEIADVCPEKCSRQAFPPGSALSATCMLQTRAACIITVTTRWFDS